MKGCTVRTYLYVPIALAITIYRHVYVYVCAYSVYCIDPAQCWDTYSTATWCMGECAGLCVCSCVCICVELSAWSVRVCLCVYACTVCTYVRIYSILRIWNAHVCIQLCIMSAGFSHSCALWLLLSFSCALQTTEPRAVAKYNFTAQLPGEQSFDVTACNTKYIRQRG